MNRKLRRKKLVAEINITPFTDVILVLLVIFMIATPLLSQSGLKVSLPQAQSAQALDLKASPLITITRDGPVYLDKKLVTNKELKEKMSASRKNNPSLSVILNIDKAVQYKDMVKVLDILSELGINNLNMAAVQE